MAYLNPDRYPLDQERTMGRIQSAALEQSTSFLADAKTLAYLERLTQKIANNSDAQVPISIRVVDSAEVDEFVLPGGYLFITQGLLLKMQNEGELASALARGVAQAALRSALRELEYEKWMQIGSIPLTFAVPITPNHGTADAEIVLPLTILDLKRQEEFDADYYGLEYIYKSGYDPECFLDFLKIMSAGDTAPVKPKTNRFSPIPPFADRLKALEKEIEKVLPKIDGAVRTTREFEEFREHLLSVPPPRAPKQPHDLGPRLIRPGKAIE